jgi:hypothetical protein
MDKKEREPLLDAREVAAWLNIRYKKGPKAGELNPKAVYELKRLRKLKVDGRVRFDPADVRLMLALSAA